MGAMFIQTPNGAERVGGGGGGVNVIASVGQTIVVKEVDANGKPTKWEAADYQPRTHWTEMGELLPETTITFIDGALEIPNSPRVIEEGKIYRITWNGEVYECVAERIVGPDVDITLIGNKLMVEGEDTGEPFSIVRENNFGLLVIVSLDDTATSAIVKVEGEVAMPIPVQYVTNALPYYVNVTGVGTTEHPYVCHDTEADLYAAYSSGREMLIKLQVYEDENGAKQFYIFRLDSYIEGKGKRIYSFAYYGIKAYIEITTQNGEVTAAKGSNN